MAVFQILSRSVPLVVPPKKRPRRLRQEWSTAIGIFYRMNISALLFIVLLSVLRSSYTFVLLPVFLSLFITNSRRYTLNVFLNSTLLYLLLTIVLALIYYSFITANVLLLHPNPNTEHIVLVTTTLAWAIILEPARGYMQSFIERRFNAHNRETIKAVEAFTVALREEIDLAQLSERILTLIEQIMQPYSVSLWIRTTNEAQEQARAKEEIAIADDDPLMAYVLEHSETQEIDQLQLDSLVLQEMKRQAAELILPLTSQGELLGLLILGPRLQGEEYAREERLMLATLASQVAPALRVAQMVQMQQEEIRERERIEQELHTAEQIQRTFLPKGVPPLVGWQLAAYYQPAREVGGDFYDFLMFEDGRLGLVIGDVSGKGIPAALLMTATRTMLRTAAQGNASPCEILARVNDLLYSDIPSGIFVTCFYALLDPKSGRLRYANAGHDLPYRRQEGRVTELRATGMPLGMMPGTLYEEFEATLVPGESLLFYSDGLIEAHNPRRDMFGLPRLVALIGEHPGGPELADFLRNELEIFTGEGWEQEDDVTLVTLYRASS